MTTEEPIVAAPLERAPVTTWIALGSALVALDVLFPGRVPHPRRGVVLMRVA